MVIRDTYKRGDMFIIPVNNSIMYVEPVYLEASSQALPEVKGNSRLRGQDSIRIYTG